MLQNSQVVSAALDGQEPALAEHVAKIAVDPTARDQWTSFVLIGDAIRGNSTPDDGFSQRILARLRRDGALPPA